MNQINIFVTAIWLLLGMAGIGVDYMRYRQYDPTWGPNRVEAERRAREREDADQAMLESGI